MMMQKQKKIQGKRNREAGARFERRVRADLESKGWIVARWTNNVKLSMDYNPIDGDPVHGILKGEELVPAKSTRFRSNTHGFPDFIAYRWLWRVNFNNFLESNVETVIESTQSTAIIGIEEYTDEFLVWEVVGIECKGGNSKHKYLNKEEKEKVKWLLDNKIFNKILIARKGKKRGEIVYE